MRCKRVSGRLKYFLGGALLCAPPQGGAWVPRTGTTAAPQPARRPGKSRTPTFHSNTAVSWNWSATGPIPPCFDAILLAIPNHTWTSGWPTWKNWLSLSQSRTRKRTSISPAPSTSPRSARSSKPWRRKSRSRNPRRPRFSGTDHAFIARIEPFDEGRAPLEHRALVHVALVGDLVGVDRWRLGHHHEPRRVGRAAAGKTPQHAAETRTDVVRPQILRCRTEEHQRAKLVAIVARDHGILDERIGRRDEPDAHRAGVHQCAGGELEVLGDAAVEDDAFRRVRRVGELHGVADAVKALVVECRPGQVGALVVARRDIGAAHPHLELSRRRHQLQLASGDRQADDAGALHEEVHRAGERRGLGRAPRREHRQAAAFFVLRQPLDT